MTSISSAIIDSITCPITADIMVDPVQGNDGQTYERSAIIQALNIKRESPITRQPMTITDLTVNASIRFLCDKYHAGEFGSIETTRPAPKVSTDKITLDHTCLTDGTNNVMLSFNVNTDSDVSIQHLSQDVVLVIDRSGSMSGIVEAKDSGGNNLENGFSIQDIVNHAAKTVAKTLDKDSRLAVIAFDDRIEIVFDLILMTEVNQSQALTKINGIYPRGRTNIYGGIEKAINILDCRDDKTRNSAILMLTDGIPNISPSRGEIVTLKKLREKKNFTTPIYTFGFGYNLQRELLYDIAKCANGANGHIPDGGMIATVFCNFIATIMSTVVMNLQLHITTIACCVMGDYTSYFDDESMVYDIGTVQYQQSRDIIVNNNGEPISYFYTYKIGGASYKSEPTTVHVSELTTSNSVMIHNNRYQLIESMRKMSNYNRLELTTEAMKVYDEMETLFTTSKFNDPLTQGMFKNLQGQIKLAVSNLTYFKRWGEFYLDQLSRSMNQQIKPNFKDEACPFGGEIFEKIVDRASDIFDTLPPPTPSMVIPQNIYGSPTVPRSAPPTSLSNYNQEGNGCIVGTAFRK
jgi:Mg-chelatase subunit ChlD